MMESSSQAVQPEAIEIDKEEKTVESTSTPSPTTRVPRSKNKSAFCISLALFGAAVLVGCVLIGIWLLTR